MDSKQNLFVNEKPSLNKRGGFLLIADLFTPLPLTLINNAINNKNNYDMPIFSKERRKKRKAKRKQKIKNVLQKVTEKTQQAKKKAALVKISPFAVVMRKMLKKRGYPAPRKLDKLSAAFYLYVIKGKTNAYEFSEGISSEYEMIKPENPFHSLNNQGGNSIEFDFNQYEINNLDEGDVGGGEAGEKFNEAQVEAVSRKADLIVTIIDKIFGLIDKITGKVKNNERLSETEKEIAQTTQENKEEIQSAETGGMFEGNKTILIIAAVVVAFFIFKK